MGLEIEHKYLVKDDSFKSMSKYSKEIRQGYLNDDPERIVRIRVLDKQSYITVKGKTHNDTRLEFEYPIPLTDAENLLELCQKPILSKIRYYVEYKGKEWEIDEFQGDLYPLILAEIELTSSDEEYEKPSFIGKNVTGNPQYYNSNLYSLSHDVLKKS